MFSKNKNVLSRERGNFNKNKINNNVGSENKKGSNNKISDFFIDFAFGRHPKLRKFLVYGVCIVAILAFLYENVNFQYHNFRTGEHIVSNKGTIKKISTDVTFSKTDNKQSSKQWLNIFKPVPNGHIYVARYAYNSEILSLHDHMSNDEFCRLAVFKFPDGFYEVFFRSNDKNSVPDKTLWFTFRSEQAIDSYVIGSVSDIVLGNFTKSGLDERAVVELNSNNCKDKFEQFVKILGY